jgi:hypothetical protein
VNEFERYRSRLQALGLAETDHVLVARLGEKILEHRLSGKRVWTAPISSGKRPRSCQDGSLGTPWGLHEVAARHGDGAPPGTIFFGRVSTGERWQDRPDPAGDPRNHVTTRILRLRGLEPGLNAGPGIDSFDRYIYIHGTNHPESFPENRSHGCLLMRDPDLIQLFDAVPEGTHVWLAAPA